MDGGQCTLPEAGTRAYRRRCSTTTSLQGTRSQAGTRLRTTSGDQEVLPGLPALAGPADRHRRPGGDDVQVARKLGAATTSVPSCASSIRVGIRMVSPPKLSGICTSTHHPVVQTGPVRRSRAGELGPAGCVGPSSGGRQRRLWSPAASSSRPAHAPEVRDDRRGSRPGRPGTGRPAGPGSRRRGARPGGGRGPTPSRARSRLATAWLRRVASTQTTTEAAPISAAMRAARSASAPVGRPGWRPSGGALSGGPGPGGPAARRR